MKTKSIQSVALAVTAFTAVALMAGCATSGYKQADKTGEGISAFRGEVVNTKTAIDNTLKALDQVAVTATSDPRPAFEKFSKEVGNLESSAEKSRSRAQSMKEKGDAYFAQWEQELAQVKDDNIRKLAQERRAKLQTSFGEIRKVAEPLKTQFDPWMSSLKDLETYLKNDLTINGVAAAKDLFAKSKSEGLKVQKSMDDLLAELNTVAATITPAKAQTASTK